MTKSNREYFYKNVIKYLNSIESSKYDEMADMTQWSIPTGSNVLNIILRHDHMKERSKVVSVFGRYDELIPGRLNCKCNFHSTQCGEEAFKQFVPWLTSAMNEKPY